MIVGVTGSNGFIGRHLCAALRARGDDVRAIVRADFASHRFEELIAGADIVIHAAAMTRAPSEAKLRQANVDLTRRVVDAVKVTRVSRLVFISSQAAAGPAESLARPVREDDAPKPIEAYGRSKIDGEEIVRGAGIEYTIVRPAAVYGPDDRDFAQAFALARLGVAIHPGNREQWISIVHVDDCVHGIIAAMTSAGASGRTYFLANDRPVQWRDVYSYAAQSRPLRVDVEVPRWMMFAAARIGDFAAHVTGHASLLTSQKVALAEPRYWICSSARARAELGVESVIAIATGIAAASGRGRPAHLSN